MSDLGLIGIGTYNFMGHVKFSDKEFGWPEISVSTKEQIIQQAISRGARLIDTADFYADGEVEEFLGSLDFVSADVKFASKAGKVRQFSNGRIVKNFSKNHIMSCAEQSLQRLKRKLFLYQLHGPDLEDLYSPHVNETISALKNSTFCEHVGISVNTNGIYDDRYVDLICQNPYIEYVQLPSILYSPRHSDVVKEFRSSGKVILGRSPFYHGIIFKLANMSNLDESDPRNDFLSDIRFSEFRSCLKATLDAFYKVFPIEYNNNMLCGFILSEIFSRQLCDTLLIGASEIHHIDAAFDYICPSKAKV